MTDRSLQIGFIGCGRIANSHADVLHHLGHRISSVSARPASSNLPAFASRYDVPRVYASLERQLADERPDAWWVVTPYSTTDTLVPMLAALDAPCFVEKPAALSSGQVERALEVQLARGTQMQVGYNRRFYQSAEAVRQQLAVDSLTAVEVHLAEPVERIRPGDLEKPDDLLFYKGTHVLDLLMHLVGPLEVRAICTSTVTEREAPNLNGLLWSISYHVPVHFSANWATPVNAGLRFHFGRRLVRIAPLERLTVFEGLQVVEPSPDRPFRVYEPVLTLDRWDDAGFKPGFLRQAQYFIDSCVLRRAATGIGATLADSLALARLCEQISA